MRSTYPVSEFNPTADGQVDASDLEELVQNTLKTRYGDTDLNGIVGQTDLEALDANFGSAVAEPHSGILVVLDQRLQEVTTDSVYDRMDNTTDGQEPPVF